MVADLSFASKKCQCGHKIDLSKVKLLAVCDSADEAGEVLREFLSARNSGFTSAEKMHDFSLGDRWN